MKKYNLTQNFWTPLEAYHKSRKNPRTLKIYPISCDIYTINYFCNLISDNGAVSDIKYFIAQERS
jgi:hypothetical protein